MIDPIDMSIETGLLPLVVKQDEDGTYFIEWDEEDPRAIEAGINEWTAEDWTDALEEALKRVKEEEEEDDGLG